MIKAWCEKSCSVVVVVYGVSVNETNPGMDTSFSREDRRGKPINPACSTSVKHQFPACYWTQHDDGGASARYHILPLLLTL